MIFTSPKIPQQAATTIAWSHEQFEINFFDIECLLQKGDIKTAAQQAKNLLNLALQAGATAYQGAVYDMATAYFMCGTVYFFQQDYLAALSAYQEAKNLFSQLDETHSIASSWHQIGVVYSRMQDYEQAEQACHESLNIKNEQGNPADIASTLNQLGNIYDDWGKLEQAVEFYRQAADSYTQLDDKLYEGVARSNIANSLIPLQRYEEARSELQQAIVCKKGLGHSAEPWKTWNILYELEHAIDKPSAAHAAKQQAIQSYLAYRRDGNENTSGSPVPQYCQGTLHAIQEDNAAVAEQELLGLPELGYFNPVIAKLIAILKGERNCSLVDDPELDFISAAELLLLLDSLSA
jgi:tetratricopeptide (TPR) repeat protein